jgi:outer membrane murein-binding lipoprotein Lpp
MRKTVWMLAAVLISACSGTTETTGGSQLPYETLTPMVAAVEPLQEIIEDLIGNVTDLEAEVARLEMEVAQLQQQLESFHAAETQAAITPTATATAVWVATSTPANVMTVEAVQKVNLRRIKSYNEAGKPIMVIQEPRIQYQVGETFQVIRQWIIVDGGGRYYEVVGPRGAGLYARATDVDPLN